MEPASTVVQAIRKLANAGQRAGFTIEQMIELLNAGLTVETLLHLIDWRLYHPGPPPPPNSSRWIM